MTYGYGWTRCLAGFFAGALIAEYWGAGLFRALRGPVAALFNARPFQYLGRVSYSLYMGHAVLKPSFSALTRNAHSPEARTLIIAAFVAVSLMLAHVLYERIEAPCRARFYRWSMRFRGGAPREAAVN